MLKPKCIIFAADNGLAKFMHLGWSEKLFSIYVSREISLCLVLESLPSSRRKLEGTKENTASL